MRTNTYIMEVAARAIVYLVILLFHLCPSTARTCERVRNTICTDPEINYNLTTFPNILGHKSQNAASLGLQQWRIHIKIGCSEYMRRFLCATYIPQCQDDAEERLDPCFSLCERARRGCEPLLIQFSSSWPSILDCRQFPQDGTKRCMGPRGIVEKVDQSTLPREGDENKIPSSFNCKTSVDIEGWGGVKFHRNMPGSRVEVNTKPQLFSRHPTEISFNFKTHGASSQVLMVMTDKRLHRGDPNFLAIYQATGGYISCSFRCRGMTGVTSDYKRERVNDGKWHKLVFNTASSTIIFPGRDDDFTCGMPSACATSFRHLLFGGTPERFLTQGTRRDLLPAKTLKGCVRRVEFDGETLPVPATYNGVSHCC